MQSERVVMYVTVFSRMQEFSIIKFPFERIVLENEIKINNFVDNYVLFIGVLFIEVSALVKRKYRLIKRRCLVGTEWKNSHTNNKLFASSKKMKFV